MANQNQTTLSWEAAEFKHYPKNTGWYTVLISLSLLSIIFFIVVERDIFAAVILALITFFIIIFSRHQPETVQIELSSHGVQFGKLLYPYKQLKHFWVVHNERHQTVNFHTSAYINNILILELEQQDPSEVRSYLKKYLPEHPETEETFAQRIMHWLNF